ncbi:hypothetical protein C1H76_7842 [Elsinoe australis]|uniref:Low temperature requirement A n=1 Tax=Elsinoe australis TaxID=40998 RepID=A0A4U7AP91_9PEZI|nr:hypothetical protein C1H76_7842 [Elsinoe australis]
MSEEQPNHLPFFASPLVRRESGTDWSVDPRSHAHFRRTSRTRSQTLSLNDVRDLSDISLDEKDTYSLDSPVFKRHSEATHSELFYDLFFVANLTVFSSVKEVNDTTTLQQYIGFFTILWFTWYQVSLYDVRFSKDSIFDRIAKAVQFGVMIGFAVNGPTFDVGEKLESILGLSSDESISIIADPHLVSFKSLTLIMMASRLVLVLQYLQALWLTRSQKESIVPMALIAGTEFVAAIVYFGLFFSFHNYHSNAYITWYAIAFLETSICTAVSSVWRNISFKGTHLTQRMSLLTLIILGEGIIGLAKKCQEIVKGQIFGFTSSTIANILSCVLIIYFLYMLYFDHLTHSHFGSIRQQIWSFLHFPLHLALVLSLDGANQFIAWRAATIRVNSLLSQLPTFSFSDPDDITNSSTSIENTVNDIIFAAFRSSQTLGQTLHYAKSNATAYVGLDLIRTSSDLLTSSPSDPETEQRAWQATNLIYNTLINSVYTSIGFSAPESEKMTSLLSIPSSLTASGADEAIASALEEITKENKEVYDVAGLIFVYFFITLGASVLLMGLMTGIERSKTGLELSDKIRLGASAVVGTTIALLAALDTGRHGKGGFASFVYSPWVLPTGMLGLLVVVVLYNVKLPGSPASVRRAFRRPLWKVKVRRGRRSF